MIERFHDEHDALSWMQLFPDKACVVLLAPVPHISVTSLSDPFCKQSTFHVFLSRFFIGAYVLIGRVTQAA